MKRVKMKGFAENSHQESGVQGPPQGSKIFSESWWVTHRAGQNEIFAHERAHECAHASANESPHEG